MDANNDTSDGYEDVPMGMTSTTTLIMLVMEVVVMK